VIEGCAPPRSHIRLAIVPLSIMHPLSARSGPDLRVETGGACIPNPQKPNKLGEDSFFITKDSKSFGEAESMLGCGGTRHNCSHLANVLLSDVGARSPAVELTLRKGLLMFVMRRQVWRTAWAAGRCRAWTLASTRGC
jgi:hypothetical protein